MIRKGFLLMAAGMLAFASCGDAPTVTCYSVDPLLKVFPENTMFMEAPDTMDAAGATHVEFQFALRSTDAVEDFKVECG